MDGIAELMFRETPPHLREFMKFLDVLNGESERGAVLVSAVMIDDLLEQSIKAFLVDHVDIGRLLEGFNAPLGTLSARTLAAFALSVISEQEYKECERLRKIRNLFAHSVHSSFDDRKVKDLCANLEMCAKDYDNVHVGARGQYTTAAVSVIANLTNRPHYAAQRRLSFKSWPY